MECKVCLETLPLETLAHIAMFLDIQDIVACCGTSSLMRHAFGDNVVWRRKCDTQLINYLKQTMPMIEPSLEWFEVTDNVLSTLSPLSEWRKYYTMYVRLIRNWREGRFEQKEIVTGVDQGRTIAKFYNNDHLFIHRMIIALKDQDNIWDVQANCVLHSTLKFNFKDYFCGMDKVTVFLKFNHIYSIVNDKLIVARCNVVLVFEISLASFSIISLASAFVFNEPKKSSNRIQANPPVYRIKTVLCNNIFIGVVTTIDSLADPILHIWDIETGNKIKEEEVPPVQSPARLVSIEFVSSNDGNDVIIKLSIQEKRCLHYLGYDLLKMKFSSFLVKLNYYCNFSILFGNYVVGNGAHKVVTYCYKTSEKLATRNLLMNEVQAIIDREEVLAIVDGKLLCGTCYSTMLVMDIHTLNIISNVKLGFILYSIVPLFNKFVILNSEIWEIGHEQKLYTLPIIGKILAVNAARTKIAVDVDHKITIINFW